MTCKDCIHYNVCKDYGVMFEHFQRFGCKHIYTTADVVPRAEVEREYGNALQIAFNDGKLEGGKEVAREIFAEIDKEYGENCGAYRIDDLTYGQLWDYLTELKKKYTEGRE